MRILTISAYYPPYSYGGYEIRVSNIMDELAARGHALCVLTTKPDPTMKAAHTDFAYPVRRVLHGASRKMRFPDRLTTHRLTHGIGVGLVFLREIHNNMRDLAQVERQFNAFKPDLIYLGHFMPLSQELLPFLAQQNLPIIVDEGYKSLIVAIQERSLWRRFLTEYSEQNPFQRLIKRSFARMVGLFSHGRMQQEWRWPIIHTFFNSRLNERNAEEVGVPLARAEVIHSGIDISFFSFQRAKPFGNPLTLLLPGRIEQNKGQLEAVELCSMLNARGIPCTLTIVGDRWKEAYAKQVEAQVINMNPNEAVRILPMQSRREMVELYHQTDICLFLSHHKTGFSRVPLEAMACGSLVFSYGYEGSDEILRDGENGFLIPEGDISTAADLISLLLNEPETVARVIQQARNDIEKNHSLGIYIEKIEDFLNRTLIC